MQTTLMDVLAGRKTGGEIEGDILINVCTQPRSHLLMRAQACPGPSAKTLLRPCIHDAQKAMSRWLCEPATAFTNVSSGRVPGGQVGEHHHSYDQMETLTLLALPAQGHPKVQATFARVSGYVEQTDIHSPAVRVLTYSLRTSVPSIWQSSTSTGYWSPCLMTSGVDTPMERRCFRVA